MSDHIEKLKNINSRLWEEFLPNRLRPVIGALNEKVLESILHIAIHYDLPCTISRSLTGDYCFDVFESPLYPGVNPENILSADSKSIITSLNENNTFTVNTKELIDIFKSMYSVASTKRNLKMLNFFSIPRPITKYDAFEYWILKAHNEHEADS